MLDSSLDNYKIGIEKQSFLGSFIKALKVGNITHEHVHPSWGFTSEQERIPLMTVTVADKGTADQFCKVMNELHESAIARNTEPSTPIDTAGKGRLLAGIGKRIKDYSVTDNETGEGKARFSLTVDIEKPAGITEESLESQMLEREGTDKALKQLLENKGLHYLGGWCHAAGQG